MSNDLGDSLSVYKNLVFVDAEDPEELQQAITSIKIPMRIVSMYHDGKKHVAWIVPSRKLLKVKPVDNK